MAYDAATRTLAVRFHANGSLYHYADVAPEVHTNMVKADSVGKFFGQHVRGKYEYERQKHADHKG